MSQARSSHDVMTGVARVRWLVYLVTVSAMMTSLPRAVSVTTPTGVEMTIVSTYTSQEYNDQLQDQDSLPYKTVNTTACGDIADAVAQKLAGNITYCSVFLAEQADSGSKLTINVTALLDGKTTQERFTLVKSAVIQVAAASSTWIVNENDVTNNSPPPANANMIPITLRMISKRTDLSYSNDYKDPLAYAYTIGSNTMCDDVKNAMAMTATVDSCEVEHFEEDGSGLKAYLKVKLSASGTDEKQAFLSIGDTITKAAESKSRWEVDSNDMTLIPAEKPTINTKSSFKMKITSTRVDINGTNIPSDPKDPFFTTAKKKMCEDFEDALYTTAVIESCEATNFTSAGPGTKAAITLSVKTDSATPTDGFISTSSQIVSMSSKRDIWTVNPGDIVFIEEVTEPPPRSVSSCIAQIPAMFLLSFVLRLIVI